MISQPQYGSIRRPTTKSESRNKLKKLSFDPIEKLVNVYDKLEAKHKHFEALRKEGPIIHIDDNGEVVNRVRYSHLGHAAILSQMEKVASQLLRYKYSRVPETVNVNSDRIPEFTINLNMEPEENDTGSI